jgi:hypothetical protein
MIFLQFELAHMRDKYVPPILKAPYGGTAIAIASEQYRTKCQFSRRKMGLKFKLRHYPTMAGFARVARFCRVRGKGLSALRQVIR